jgi:hypothetical protein
MVFVPAGEPSGFETFQLPTQKSNSACFSVQQLQLVVCAFKLMVDVIKAKAIKFFIGYTL